MNENILKILLPSKNPFIKEQHGRNADSDREIILPLVILLMADRCDFFLIFALMYILM
ncbi:MAG: hypothetical protein IJE48_09390 [Clostridia bacterium]|nr:hypothetical protein [Clostridia bacterium]